MLVLQNLFWILGAVLQVLTLASLARGPYRKYPVLGVYLVILLLSTVVEVSSMVNPLSDEVRREHLWISNAIKQVLLFSVVFEFISRAWQQSPNRRYLPHIVAGAIIIAVIAFLTHQHGSTIGPLMTNAIAYLSFYSAALNLFLWSLLLRKRDRDRQLLTVTGGLGIQFTAEAVGQSVRNLAIPRHSLFIANTGNVILATGHLLCLYFWWQALRRPPVEPSRSSVTAKRVVC